nr:serine/threonine protein kinase [Gemmatimonadaceae bacterium]
MSADCRRCGAALAPGGRFCAGCGLGVDASGDGAPTIVDAREAAESGTVLPRVSLATPDVVLPILRDATQGEYDVHRLVGTGGMSYVFEATELALQRKVAIKVMVPGLVPDPALRERFKREARTAASLTHPAIIPIHAVRESEQLVYFVMKYIDGRTLETILAMQGALPTALAQSVVAQVAAGLAYAHRRGVVHRDVKPANILIDEHGFAVVTDFGIAKVDDARRLTGTGSILGTPHYMAPEQFAGQNVGPASDQYALGAVAYECLVGAPPFTGETIAEVMKGHLFDEPVPVRTRRADCPAAIADVVMRMLAKSPAQRFASLEDVGQRLGSGAAAADAPIREALGALARASDPLTPRGTTGPQATAIFDGQVPPTLARREVSVPVRPRGVRWLAAAGAVAIVAALLRVWQGAGGDGAGDAMRAASGPASGPVSGAMPSASSGQGSGSEEVVDAGGRV